MSGGEREPGAMPEWAAGPASQYRGLLALEFGDRAQFANPRHEWRRLFAELLGNAGEFSSATHCSRHRHDCQSHCSVARIGPTTRAGQESAAIGP